MPAIPALPEALEDLVARLLAKRAAERPTAAEALAVLQQVAATRGEDPYTPPEVYAHTPEHERAKWHNWAISYNRFGLHQEALVRSDRALALAPTDGAILLNHGDILGALGRLEEALGCYDQALASFPTTDSFHRAVVWNNRGAQLNEAGRYAEAEAAYAQAVALMPEDPAYWHNRADNEGRWGLAVAAAGPQGQQAAEARVEGEAEQHWRKGLGYAEQATQLNPNNPNYTRLRDALRQALGGW